MDISLVDPQTTAYNELGQSCCAAGVSVELFLCNNSYVDAATLGQLPRLTGGQLHKYTYFTVSTHPTIYLELLGTTRTRHSHLGIFILSFLLIFYSFILILYSLILILYITLSCRYCV